MILKFSTLLTACLTYHLGWIEQYVALNCKTVLAKKSIKIKEEAYQKVVPSKTIIIGEDSEKLKRLVYVFSYFIRLGGPSMKLGSLTKNNDCDLWRKNPDDNQNHDKNIASDVHTAVPLNSFLDQNKVAGETSTTKTIPSKKDQTLNISQEDFSSASRSNHLQKKVSFIVGATTDIPKTAENMATLYHKLPLKEIKRTIDDNKKYALIISLPNSIR